MDVSRGSADLRVVKAIEGLPHKIDESALAL
jgi:hypothetical protein